MIKSWLCFFFFVWSNIARPFIKYVVIYFELYKIIPWEIDLVIINKIINYGFALEYWEFIFLLSFILYKIFLDMYNYDEDNEVVDYYKDIKGTYIYRYSFIFELISNLKWIFFGIAAISRILLIYNPMYINDILVILSLVLFSIDLAVVLMKYLWREK